MAAGELRPLLETKANQEIISTYVATTVELKSLLGTNTDGQKTIAKLEAQPLIPSPISFENTNAAASSNNPLSSPEIEMTTIIDPIVADPSNFPQNRGYS